MDFAVSATFASTSCRSIEPTEQTTLRQTNTLKERASV